MNAHKKELLLTGGSAAIGGPIYQYLAELAKPEGKIGFVGFASTDDVAHAEKMQLWTEFFGGEGIQVVEVTSADDCYGLGVVYLGGGDQNKLLAGLESSGIDELLRPAWKYGDVVLGGTSAGAMVLFWDMLADGDDETYGSGSVRKTKGMGPMSGGLVIPHFNTVDSAFIDKLVKEHGDMCLIGIDEDTALRWKMGVCDVIGTGKVTLLGRSSGVYAPGEEFDLGSTRN